MAAPRHHVLVQEAGKLVLPADDGTLNPASVTVVPDHDDNAYHLCAARINTEGGRRGLC